MGKPKSKKKTSKRSIDDLDLDSLRGGEIPLKRDPSLNSAIRGGEILIKRYLDLDSQRGGEIPLKRGLDYESLRGGEIPLKRDLSSFRSMRGGEIPLKRNLGHDSHRDREFSLLQRELVDSFPSEESSFIDRLQPRGGEIPLKRRDAGTVDDSLDDEHGNYNRQMFQSFINKLAVAEDWDSNNKKYKRSIRRRVYRGGEIPMKRHLANGNYHEKNLRNEFDSIDKPTFGFKRRNLDTIDQTTLGFKRNFDSIDHSTFGLGRKQHSNSKISQSDSNTLSHVTHRLNLLERVLSQPRTSSDATQGQGQSNKNKRHVSLFDSIEHQSTFGDFDANVVSRIALQKG